MDREVALGLLAGRNGSLMWRENFHPEHVERHFPCQRQLGNREVSTYTLDWYNYWEHLLHTITVKSLSNRQVKSWYESAKSVSDLWILFLFFVFVFQQCNYIYSLANHSFRKDIQSKRIVFISASEAHHKWLVFCRTFAGNLLYCFITSMEHVSALPLSQSLQGFLWQIKTSKRMLKLQQSKPKKTGKFFVSYRTGSVFTDQQCLWKVKFKFDKASFIIILI